MSSLSSNGGGGIGGHRVPIFHDDLSFGDRRGRSLFSDLQRRMDEDFANMGMRSGLRGPRQRNQWGDWDDDMDNLCKDFFELRPRNPKLGKLSREDASSRESLDDSTKNDLFIEDPESKSRMFQISFNVQEYNPEDISVKVLGDTLVVEAKHEDNKGGNKSTREFNRKIAIPKEVDPDKLSSVMSNDGILTIKAPMPPQYHSVSPVSSDTSRTPSSSTPSTTGYQPQPPTSFEASSSVPAQNFQTYGPASSYAPPFSPPPAAGPAGPAYQYPAPQSAQYYAPPPPTQPRMSAPVPNMQPMGSPPMAHTMTSPSPPGAVYYPQNYPVTSQPDFPPPPPPGQAFSPPPMPHDFPPPPPLVATVAPTLDIPLYTDTPTGRRMDLVLFLGPPYTPDDILVKVDGKSLIIEATHMEKKDNKTSKASMSREFELEEDINPQTVQANLTNDGHLKLAAMVPVQTATPATPDASQLPASEPQTTTAAQE